MEITNELRDQVFASGTEKQRHLYSSPESGSKLWRIAENHGLVSSEIYNHFSILIGDVILNLIPRTELPDLLKKNFSLSSTQSLGITADILDFLDSKTESTLSLYTTQKEAAAPNHHSVSNQHSEINETDTSSQTVPKIRVMADDMAHSQQAQEEKVHTSTQDSILRRDIGSN